MALILFLNTTTTKDHTEIKTLTPTSFVEKTVDNTANGRAHAKGYEVTVNYEWIYP